MPHLAARFTPTSVATYCLKVQIFDRPIKDCPLFFDVTEHNSPILSFGSRGLKDKGGYLSKIDFSRDADGSGKCSPDPDLDLILAM